MRGRRGPATEAMRSCVCRPSRSVLRSRRMLVRGVPDSPAGGALTVLPDPGPKQVSRCCQPIASHGTPWWSRGALARLALATLAAGCGGGDLVVPGTDNTVAIRVVEGDGQRGSVGEPLTSPVVVEVTDAGERPGRGRHRGIRPHLRGVRRRDHAGDGADRRGPAGRRPSSSWATRWAADRRGESDGRRREPGHDLRGAGGTGTGGGSRARSRHSPGTVTTSPARSPTRAPTPTAP